MGMIQLQISTIPSKTILVIGYYDLFRVGEIATGDHPIKYGDIFTARYEQKIQVILRSSKTHTKSEQPQVVKINANSELLKGCFDRRSKFCPVAIVDRFLDARSKSLKGFGSKKRIAVQPLFAFSDNTPVKPEHFRPVLKKGIKECGLDPNLYDCHSLRSGWAMDLVKSGMNVHKIKLMGCWKSYAVYRYNRDTN